MAKFIRKPRSERSLKSLPTGTVIYAKESGESVRWISVGAEVPGLEQMLRPLGNDWDINDLSVEEFLILGWEVEYAVPPSVDSLLEIAISGSKLIFDAQKEDAQQQWYGEILPELRQWVEGAITDLREQA